MRNHRRQVQVSARIGAILVGMAIFAVGLFVPMGLGAGSGTSGDQTYSDATGDSSGRLDLTRVRLSNSGDWLEVRFTTREKTINVGENIFMNIDTDVDGTRNYQFSFRGGGSGTIGYLKYPSSKTTYDPAPASLATACCQDFGVTLRIRLSGIDNPARLRFNVGAKEADEPNTWDWLPNTGFSDFTVRETTTTTTTTTPPPKPTTRRVEVQDSWIRPNAPKAGSKVTVGASFVYSDNGQPVRAGRVACRASVGSVALVGTPTRNGGTGACAFRLPATSAGKTFRGRVTMTYRGSSDYSEILRAVGVSRRLKLEDLTKNTPAPLAGEQFQTSYAVYLEPPRRRLADGKVTCDAVLGGKKLVATIAQFLRVGGRSGALCAWQIPASSQGATLRTRITVQAAGLTVSRPLRFTVR